MGQLMAINVDMKDLLSIIDYYCFNLYYEKVGGEFCGVGNLMYICSRKVSKT